jgi:hypothetical protein
MCLWRAAKGLAVTESSGSTEMMLAAAAHLGCTSIATMAHYYSANKCLLCLPLQHDRYALAALCRAQRSRVCPIKRHEGIENPGCLTTNWRLYDSIAVVLSLFLSSAFETVLLPGWDELSSCSDIAFLH